MLLGRRFRWLPRLKIHDAYDHYKRLSEGATVSPALTLFAEKRSAALGRNEKQIPRSAEEDPLFFSPSEESAH
jgi:hypothetical protein